MVYQLWEKGGPESWEKEKGDPGKIMVLNFENVATKKAERKKASQTKKWKRQSNILY